MKAARITQVLALVIVLLLAAPAIASSHKDKEGKGDGRHGNTEAMCEKMERMKGMDGKHSMGMGKDMMEKHRQEMVERLDLSSEQERELRAMQKERREKMDKRMEKMKERCASMDD